MPHLPTVNIHIDGVSIGSEFITSLVVRQAYHEHTRFELQVYSDRSGDADKFSHDNAQKLLAGDVSIALNDEARSAADNTLQGFFTDLTFSNDYASAREVVVLGGYGNTIKLDGGKSNKFHGEKVKVSDVVNKIISGAGLSGQVKSFSTQIETIAQYGETDFEFLQRLAAEYGVVFYQEGKKLYFDEPKNGAEIALSYPAELSECNLRVKLLATGYEEATLDFKQSSKMNAKSSPNDLSLDAFGKNAQTKAKSVFSKPVSQALSPRWPELQESITDSVRAAQGRAAGGITVLEAASDSPFVQVGTVVRIKAPGISDLKYRVTSVEHRYDAGVYSNRFEAVPESLKVIPSPYFRKPFAEPQLGVVTANKDPEGLGFVRARLMWPDGDEETPWMPVMRPDGDGSEDHGYHFLPEINDYVMVGFRQNDPDRPFVMGAIPTGKTAKMPKFGNDNDYRAIAARGGSKIFFLSESSDQQIRIQTDDSNYIDIAKKGSDGTIKIYSTTAVEVKSKTIKLEATDSITLNANSKIEIKSAQIAIEASSNLTAKGQTGVKIEGAQVEAKASATLGLQAGAMAELKGAIVKIN